MASVTLTTSGSLDGTTIYGNITLSETSRTSTSVTLSYTTTTYLSSSGYSQGGYESYNGAVAISGSGVTSKTTNITLKPLADTWSGSTQHTLTGSITVNTTSSSSLTLTIKYTVTSSRDSVNKNEDTDYLSITAGLTAPSTPTNLSVSSTKYAIGDTLTISWTKAGTQPVTGYYVQYSTRSSPSASWSAWSALRTVTTTSTTYTTTALSGGGVRFRVAAYNSAGTSSYTSASSIVTITGAMKIKVSNAWKIGTTWIKVGGTWKRAKKVWVKVNGVWKDSTV